MEANKTKNTCEEQIDQELTRRLEQFLPQRDLNSKGQLLTTAEIDALESAARCEVRVFYKLCLSFGSPTDYFELEWSPDSRAWVAGRYVIQDRFDSPSRPLSAQQVEELANVFGIDPEAG